MPNGTLKPINFNHAAQLKPYAKGGLSGEAVGAMVELDLQTLPWDQSKNDLAQKSFERVKRSQTRFVLRFKTNGPAGTPIQVYAKRYRVFGPLKKIISLFQPSRSRREWDLGWGLLRREIPTAMPLLWAERRRWGMVAESYLVSLGIERGSSFLEIWRAQATPEMRHEWLERLAHITRQAHEKGFAHDDLSAEHVLVVAGQPAASSPPQFYFIDLDHGRLMKKITPYRRAHNFFQIFRSLPSQLLGPAERRAFLLAYSDGKWSDGEMASVERAVRMIGKIKKIRKKILGFWRR